MIKIQAKDDRTWVRVDGTEVDWTNYSVKYKDDRVQPVFMAPSIIEDTWNEQSFAVQHEQYDVYSVEFTVKESEKKYLSQLKSLSDITIIDYEINDSNTIVNASYIVDSTKPDNIEIEEIVENIALTTGARYRITFKTNRLLINKGLPVNLTNKINFGGTWYRYFDDTQSLVYGFTDSFDQQTIIARQATVLQKFQLQPDGWHLLSQMTGLNINDADVAVLDDNTVVTLEGLQTIQAYQYSGTSWSTYGSSLDTTRNGSRLASLDATTIAVYSSNDSSIRTFSLSGGTWSQTGNTLLTTSGTAGICSLTSTKIALIDPTSKELRDYDWDGTDWTVNSTVATTLNGTCVVAKLDTNRVALVSSTELKLKSYTLNGTWVSDATDFTVSGSNVAFCGLDTDSVALYGDIYNLGVKYYSDFDVLDWAKQTDDVVIPWYDGTNKKAVSIAQKGYEYIQYIEEGTHDEFIGYIKSTNSASINDTTVTELEYELSTIAEGLMKIIVRGVVSTTRTVFDLAPNSTYTLSMNSGAIPYYSDYPYYERIRDTQKIDVEWDDGSIKTMQTIKKLSYEFVYFTNDPQTFIKNVGTYSDVTLNSDVLSEIEISQEEIALNLFKIILNGVHTLDVDTLYTFPTSGTAFAITLGTSSPNTYYTDYDVMKISEGADKNTVKNQTGINTTTKSITKEVKQVKFFMTETNAFNLKNDCELFKNGDTCTLAGATVYEITNSDNIEPTKLGVNLYEVNVNVLTDVTTN